MLIKETEKTQDLLFQFIYGEKFSTKIPKDLRIHPINLLKPEVKQFEDERRRKKSTQTTLGIIEEKKQRKLSMEAVHSAIVGQNQPIFQGKMKIRMQNSTVQSSQSDTSGEEKLNTDKQIEIMDTITELQRILQFSQ